MIQGRKIWAPSCATAKVAQTGDKTDVATYTVSSLGIDNPSALYNNSECRLLILCERPLSYVSWQAALVVGLHVTENCTPSFP